ncbi:hypothetical protein TNCV_2061 [Trichonephila clavipes]|nr:hypothetical protein TNCV_2061 [Trichonephila clavipes]
MSTLPKKMYTSVVAPSFGGELNEPSRKTSCCSVLIVAENCNSADFRKLFKAQVNTRKEKIGIRHVKEISDNKGTATAGSDVVQSGSPIFDDFFQHLWPYIGNNTANVVFQMVKRLWLIRIDQ